MRRLLQKFPIEVTSSHYLAGINHCLAAGYHYFEHLSYFLLRWKKANLRLTVPTMLHLDHGLKDTVLNLFCLCSSLFSISWIWCLKQGSARSCNLLCGSCSSFISETAEEKTIHTAFACPHWLIMRSSYEKSAGKLETVEGFHLLKQMKKQLWLNLGSCLAQILCCISITIAAEDSITCCCCCCCCWLDKLFSFCGWTLSALPAIKLSGLVWTAGSVEKTFRAYAILNLTDLLKNACTKLFFNILVTIWSRKAKLKITAVVPLKLAGPSQHFPLLPLAVHL